MIDLQESPEYIFSGLIDARTTCIFWEVFVQRHLTTLLETEKTGENIQDTLVSLALNLSTPVKNNMIEVRGNQRELMTDSKRTIDSPSRFCICGHPRQGEEKTCTYPAILTDLIIVCERRTEDDTCHTIELMNPLFSLSTQTRDVAEADRQSTQPPVSLRNSRINPGRCTKYIFV